MRCASYCTTEYYALDALHNFIPSIGALSKVHDNALHVRLETSSDADIFIFAYGCLNFWGLNEEEEHAFIKAITQYSIHPLADYTVDTSHYVDGPETLIIEEKDEIVLASPDPLIKLSLSHALTQSVKLEAFEQSIENTIKNTRHLPNELAEKGQISLSRKRLSKKIGALFSERNSVNLHSDILDTPEFFWRRPRYEPFYILARGYMDIDQRLDVLNKRLDVIHELYDILSNELKHAHSSRLEWIIILLIVSEVVMIVLKDVVKWI
jgi:uncharacterized Rmd1/YagE family protein